MAESFPHAELQGVAAELIKFFGRDVTLRRTSNTPANPARPWEGSDPDAASSVTTPAAFISFTASERAGAPSIQQTDKRCYIGVQAEDIDRDWQIIEADGSQWEIVDVLDKSEPGPLVIYYDLQVRI